MKVTGSNNVNKVLNMILNKIGHSDKTSKAALLTGATSNYGMGVTVENPRIATLEKHYANVPDFEYNKHQYQLLIRGPLMGGATEEISEI